MTSSTQANRGLRDVAEDQYIAIRMLSLLLLIQILSLNHETTPERRASGLSLWAPGAGYLSAMVVAVQSLSTPGSSGLYYLLEFAQCPLSW